MRIPWVIGAIIIGGLLACSLSYTYFLIVSTYKYSQLQMLVEERSPILEEGSPLGKQITYNDIARRARGDLRFLSTSYLAWLGADLVAQSITEMPGVSFRVLLSGDLLSKRMVNIGLWKIPHYLALFLGGLMGAWLSYKAGLRRRILSFFSGLMTVVIFAIFLIWISKLSIYTFSINLLGINVRATLQPVLTTRFLALNLGIAIVLATMGSLLVSMSIREERRELPIGPRSPSI